MCHPIFPGSTSQPQSLEVCAAHSLGPTERQHLAVHALARSVTICQLARDLQVSRKFVYQQCDRAEQALEQAFANDASESEQVLFQLPVSKDWLRQLVLGLVLIGHSSFRGVVELFRDLFDYDISVGTVFNIVHQAVVQAQQHNGAQDLSGIRIGAHDEIFQAGQPVLVGADVASTYCYLLSLEEQRDQETWAVRLLELQDHGFRPQATIADFGAGLRAGQALASPQVPCHGDVFHALQTALDVLTHLDNRAYQAIGVRTGLERIQARNRRRMGRPDLSQAQKLRYARLAETQAITLAEDVALLCRWWRADVLAVNGLGYRDRCALYDFLVQELRTRAPLCPQQLNPLVTFLENQRDDLLAFGAQLDLDLQQLAQKFQIDPALVHMLLDVQALSLNDSRRWLRDVALRQRLGPHYHALSVAVGEIQKRTVRASSVIENLNSRLRNYFFLRHHLGRDYLALLQFFLNHRRFLRSEHPDRVNRSPAELLTGKSHPHWLTMLGFVPFSRN
jgi:hypothetical protein